LGFEIANFEIITAAINVFGARGLSAAGRRKTRESCAAQVKANGRRPAVQGFAPAMAVQVGHRTTGSTVRHTSGWG